eukprot:scaffold45423_cov60-Phaeocystis_antarctica.AAC.5
MAKGKPAHPAVLALLCSAALVLGVSPCLSTSIMSLVSDPPPQPVPAWQCNAQDGSVVQDGVVVHASLPCIWVLTEAVTTEASCAGAELLVAIGRKEVDRQNLQLVRHTEDISWFNIGTVWTSSRNAGNAQVLRESWPRVGRRALACRGFTQLEVAPFYPRRCLPAAVAAGALSCGRPAISAAVAHAGTCPVGRERERDLVALFAVTAALFAAVATTADVVAFVTAFAAAVTAVAFVTAAAAAAALAAALAATTVLEPAGLA